MMCVTSAVTARRPARPRRRRRPDAEPSVAQRHEAAQGAERGAQPDPGRQRIEIEPDHPAGVGLALAQGDVEVAQQLVWMAVSATWRRCTRNRRRSGCRTVRACRRWSRQAWRARRCSWHPRPFRPSAASPHSRRKPSSRRASWSASARDARRWSRPRPARRSPARRARSSCRGWRAAWRAGAAGESAKGARPRRRRPANSDRLPRISQMPKPKASAARVARPSTA